MPLEFVRLNYLTLNLVVRFVALNLKRFHDHRFFSSWGWDDRATDLHLTLVCKIYFVFTYFSHISLWLWLPLKWSNIYFWSINIRQLSFIVYRLRIEIPVYGFRPPSSRSLWHCGLLWPENWPCILIEKSYLNLIRFCRLLFLGVGNIFFQWPIRSCFGLQAIFTAVKHSVYLQECSWISCSLRKSLTCFVGSHVFQLEI